MLGILAAWWTMPAITLGIALYVKGKRKAGKVRWVPKTEADLKKLPAGFILAKLLDYGDELPDPPHGFLWKEITMLIATTPISAPEELVVHVLEPLHQNGEGVLPEVHTEDLSGLGSSYLTTQEVEWSPHLSGLTHVRVVSTEGVGRHNPGTFERPYGKLSVAADVMCVMTVTQAAINMATGEAYVVRGCAFWIDPLPGWAVWREKIGGGWEEVVPGMGGVGSTYLTSQEEAGSPHLGYFLTQQYLQAAPRLGMSGIQGLAAQDEATALILAFHREGKTLLPRIPTDAVPDDVVITPDCQVWFLEGIAAPGRYLLKGITGTDEPTWFTGEFQCAFEVVDLT